MGITSHINSPTRITSTSSSAIDCMISNNHSCQTKVVELGLSDHNAQILNLSHFLKAAAKIPNSVQKRVFSETQKRHFKNYLSEIKWGAILNTNSNMDTNFDSFLQTFLLGFHNHFPKKSFKVNSQPHKKPWLTLGLKISLNKKREMSSRAKSSTDPLFLSFYKSYVKLLRKLIQISKKTCHDKKLQTSDNKPRTMWKIVQKETGKIATSKELTSVVINGSVVTDKHQMANHFNNFFIREPSTLAPPPSINRSLLRLHQFSPAVVSSLFMAPTNEQEVLKTIQSLKNKFSSGWDEISPNLLKYCSDELSCPLTFLINQSLQEGKFPSKLKFTVVKPLFKKEDPSLLNNYRPIALIPSISKIFEKIVLSRLSSHLVRFNIINQHQYGFQKGKSTVSALYDFTNRVFRALDESQKTMGVFCDLSKAFDCVNHDILLSKLCHYGVRGLALDWFRSFLSHRKQSVSVTSANGSFSSSWNEVHTGVPQGCILSPVLFLIYINDLKCTVEDSHITMFADDVSVLIASSKLDSLRSSVGIIVSELLSWFQDNGLLLNLGKTNATNFHLGHSPQTEAVDISLPSVSALKLKPTTVFLGVTFDQSLTWRDHVEKLRKKLNSATFALRVLKTCCSIETLLVVYRGYCESLIRYAISIWGSSPALDKILKCQKKILRTIFSAPKRHSCKNFFRDNNILTAHSLYVQEALIFIFHHRDNLACTGDFHSHNTRHGRDLCYLQHKTATFERSPLYAGLKFFNKLPCAIKSEKSLTKFKNKIKSLLITQAVYSIDEFLDNQLF